MRRWGTAVLLILAVSGTAAARGTWSLETAWVGRQVFPATGGATGVETEVSAAAGSFPRFGGGLALGLEVDTVAGGGFRSIEPYAGLRAGVQFPLFGTVVLSPWAGATAGWAIAPADGGFRWAPEFGFDTEVRVWGRQYGMATVFGRPDGTFGFALGLRDRSTWRIPNPPLPTPPPPGPELTSPQGRSPLRPTVPRTFVLPKPLLPLVLSVTTGPGRFSPDGDGVEDTLALVFGTSDPTRVVSWSWSIVAPQGQIFFQATGRGVPPSSVTWNGVSTTGELVSSATDYQVTFETIDDQGRKSAALAGFTTDVLLLKDKDRYLIRLPSINFTANSPQLGLPSEAPAGTDQLQVTLVEQNAQVLGRLAEILKKFPQYSITIVGHANLVNWADPGKAKEEDAKESTPLSLQRAQSVKDSLVALGLDPARINVQGAGGSRPLFPFGDRQNAWKNRRVDVILDRKAPTK